jgi:hypothetical protein
MTFATCIRTSRQPVLHSVGEGVIVVRFPQTRSGIGRIMHRRTRSDACEVFLLLAHIATLCFRDSSIGCGETGETDNDDNWAPRDSRRGNGESFCDIRGCANVTSDGADADEARHTASKIVCRDFADALEAGGMSDAQRARCSSRGYLDSFVARCTVTPLGKD